MESEEKTALFDKLKEKVSVCQNCPLCRTRTHTVFGRGSENASVLFIGEAPGENEDLQGKPFVGAAGHLLDSFLDYAGLEEDDYYIANILKCRPPRNRDPLPEEENACMGFLREQVRLIRPKMIVCLGRIAAQRILDPEFRITRQHGIFYDMQGIRITATFHPAALLRDPAKKEAALLDFKKIRSEALKLKNN